MKILRKKGILQKTILVILSILVINFTIPTYSNADFGGVLLSPVVDLFCSLGDAVVNLLQLCLTGEVGSTGVKEGLNHENPYLIESDEFFKNDKYSNMRYTEEEIETMKENGTYIQEVDVDEDFVKGWLGISDKYYIPVATYSPEQIFTNNVARLDINFINPNKYQTSSGKEIQSTASQLQPTIAKWYVALRNLAIVGLLSVLVYVGIRILLSSTAPDKAKYKQMFTDWLIALCLLFFLHYIMSFVLTLTESITQAIGGDGKSTVFIHAVSSESNSSGYFSTNLLGMARFKAQYSDFFSQMAYLILYLALVIYTLIFTWTYLKRMLMMAFLTIIAPLVALTYPIDKIGDGSAQAFNTWLKEYVFNALLQPFHLIIYIVFVGSAMDLAQTNIIYAIAAMGFILPAEKILRNIFGFNKASAGTVGALTGFTAGSLLSRLGKGRGGSGASKGGTGKSEQEKPVRFEKKHDVRQIEMSNANAVGDNNGGAQQNEEQNIHDRATEMLSQDEQAEKEELENYFNNTSNEDAYMNPEEYQRKLDRMQELENKQEQQNNSQGGSSDQSQADNVGENKEEKNKPHRLRNLARYHLPRAGEGALRAIGGVAKFGTRTAFKAGAGTLAAAVAAASGGGLAGASAAFMAGANVGGKLGDAVTKIPGAVVRAPSAIKSAIGREIDIANGNTNYQDAASIKEWKKDKNNLQYLRDQMAAENGGIIPSNKEVKQKMSELDPYIKEGITDIKTMLKAQKSEIYTGSAKQSAIISMIGQEKGITADVLNDSKKVAQQQANLRQEFINKGYSEANATKQANYTINVLKAQNGVAHNLKPLTK